MMVPPAYVLQLLEDQLEGLLVVLLPCCWSVVEGGVGAGDEATSAQG